MHIVIRSVEKRRSTNPAEFVRWMCEVFDLANTDDNGKAIEQEILEKLIIASRLNTGISSSEIKPSSNVARSTIIYHLNRLIDTGLVVKRGRKYYLRGADMTSAIKEVEYDIEREMSSLLDAASEFDSILSEQMDHIKNRYETKSRR
ncbi:MAG: hypothetical protein M1125_01185 [Candidatus Marsarchaeota archaeon]|nr:hypothetical protein [Candidatus Marsarchaeota archaeon]